MRDSLCFDRVDLSIILFMEDNDRRPDIPFMDADIAIIARSLWM